MSWPRPIRIVGVGSPHGDDSVGWEVVRRLQEQTVPSHCKLYRVDGGQRLLDVLDDRGTLILIDALQPNGQPGAIVYLQWPDERIAQLRAGSTHDMGPSEALALAEVVGILPSNVLIIGVEAESVEPQGAMSPAVSRATESLLQRLSTEIT